MTDYASEPLWEDDPSLDDAPRRVGPFTIEGEVGRGTFAIVYAGRQTNPDRAVAVKLLRPGMDRGEARRRFEREATVLARCQHPGIAQVYEAGRAELGRGLQSYIAMELVPGLALTTHAERNGLDTTARARLLLRLLEAMAFAHECGVVHRDLKPSNVLVTPEGEPKVIDFGVARFARDADGRTLQTRKGELLGTIQYMSPEQLEGEVEGVGPASDVYSLGVLAFELFTGRLPYESRSLALVASIREARTLRAGSVDPRLAGDIEAILCKALEEEPGARYSNAREMAADVARFLRHEPVRARPPSLVYQLRKLARRNPLFVGSVAAAFLFLVLGLLGTSHGLAASTRARSEAATSHAAMRALALAELRIFFDEIRPRVAGTALQERVLGELERQVAKLLALDPNDAALLAADARLMDARASLVLGAGGREAAVELLERARARTERACALAPDDVDALRARSLIRIREGDLLKHQGRFEAALERYLEGLRWDEQLASAHPDHPRLADDVCWGYNRVGWIHLELGRLEEADGWFVRARAAADSLATWDPEPLRARYAQCVLMGSPIQAALRRADYPTALALAEERVPLAEALVRDAPHELPYRQVLAGAYGELASLLERSGQFERALALGEASTEERRFLAHFLDTENVRQLIVRLESSVRHARLRGSQDEAEERAREMVSEGLRKAELIPDAHLSHWIEAHVYQALATTLEPGTERDDVIQRAHEAFELLCADEGATVRDFEEYAAFARSLLQRADLALELLERARAAGRALGSIGRSGEARLLAALETTEEPR